MTPSRPPPRSELDELVALAQRFAEGERYDEAAELYTLALRLDPHNTAVKLALGDIRRRQRQYKDRRPRSLRETFREEFRREAIDASHFLGLAHLYAEKGENARAVECLEVAKAKDPVNPGPYKLHGRILFRQKDYGAAAEELAKALRFNPFDREVAEALGQAQFERKQFAEALRSTVHALLLLHEGDSRGTDRLRRRIRTCSEILGLEHQELVQVFHECQERLHTAYDRLEWHRERFREQEGLLVREGLGITIARPSQTGHRIALAARLRQLKLWSHLSDEHLFELARVAQEEFYERGGLIFPHGSPGEDIYMVERGEVRIQRPTSYGTFTLGQLGPGEVFGEVSFVSRVSRSGEVLASRPSQLLRLDAGELRRLIDSSPDLGVDFYWTLWHALAQKLRRTNDQLKSFFSAESLPENFVRLRRRESAAGAVHVDADDKIRLFREQGLSRRELLTLATFSREKRFPDGAHIFHEGEEGREMYVVLEGKARISKFIPGAGEEALAILGRGDFFGEMSLIDGEPRSADARAHGGPVTVLALDQATVKEVLTMDPHASLEFLTLLCRLISDRLREIDEKVIGWRILSSEGTSESVSA